MDAKSRWNAYRRADVEAAFEQYQRRGLDGQMGRVANEARQWRVTPLGVTTVWYVEQRGRRTHSHDSY